jgi:hypothetical protein
MVMSVSPAQSVLWDQIQYSGEPEEFAWVLPVKPGARIEAGTAAFFEVLEATTAARIVPPPLDCGGGSGAGCGATALASAEGGDGDDASRDAGDPVDVLHHGTVGPYETVTLSTEEPGALNVWLGEHGYAVDPATQPVIDQYVAEGFDFIALRLLPGKGVQEMTPVRVVSPGGGLSLPLRMVAIGTGAQTPIVLYVVGEGRYTVQNFSEVRLPTELLAWNFRTSTSNYEKLRLEALAQNGGKSFLATYAQVGTLTGTYSDVNFEPVNFLDLYATQAFTNGETTFRCHIGASNGSGSSLRGGLVKNPCPAGEPWDSPLCGQVAPGEIDARTLGCQGLDDIATALEGLHLEDVWVTRLEANLPREALATDLVLQAEKSQEPVSRNVQASIALEPEGACPSAVPVLPELRGAPPKPPPFGLYALVLAGAAAAFVVRKLAPRVLGQAR